MYLVLMLNSVSATLHQHSNMQQDQELFLCGSQVLDHGTLVLELGSGLTFPATDYLSHFIHTHALQGKHTLSL